VSDTPPEILDEMPELADYVAIEDGTANECDICGRSDFKNERGLRRHLSIAHGQKTDATDKAPKLPGTSKRTTNLEKELLELFGMVVTVLMFVSPLDAMVLAQPDPMTGVSLAERNAKAWAKLAAKTPWLAAAISNLSTASVYSEVVMAGIATAIPIMANHNMIPAGLGAFASQAQFGDNE
jgi:hypothetical protein